MTYIIVKETYVLISRINVYDHINKLHSWPKVGVDCLWLFLYPYCHPLESQGDIASGGPWRAYSLIYCSTSLISFLKPLMFRGWLLMASCYWGDRNSKSQLDWRMLSGWQHIQVLGKVNVLFCSKQTLSAPWPLSPPFLAATVVEYVPCDNLPIDSIKSPTCIYMAVLTPSSIIWIYAHAGPTIWSWWLACSEHYKWIKARSMLKLTRTKGYGGFERV